MSRWGRWVLVAAVAALAFAVVTVVRRAPRTPEEAPPGPPPPVDVAVAPGVVQPPGGEIRFGPGESGQVVAVLVREGERVLAGDPMVQLEAGAQLQQLAVSQAELAVAEAQLAKVESGARREDVAALVAEGKAATARAARAKSTYLRARRLVRRGAATRASVDELRREWQAQRAAANAALERAQAARSGPTEADVAVARAQVEAARARVRLAEDAVARRTARAPADATILSVEVLPGELWSPMSPAGARSLVVLGTKGPLEVVAQVDELFASRVQRGAPAEVVSEAGEQLLARGHVSLLEPRMGMKTLVSDRASEPLDRRVREVTVALDGETDLVPGARVRVRVKLAPPRSTDVARARRGR